MPANRESLLAGRNATPLNDNDVRRATHTFLALDLDAPVRYEEGARTRFRVLAGGGEYGDDLAEIVFGPDLYPGASVVDPNSSMSVRAAVAHELCHWHRWQNHTEIVDERLDDIDEALTSLEAVLRYPRHLSEHEVRQLVSDAIFRLQRFCQK
jgi:predicted SprT family Zn-dependent metalloprotease